MFSIMAEQTVMNSSDLDAQACWTLLIMCVVQVPLSSDAICWLRLLIARYYAAVHIVLYVTAWSIEKFLHAGCQRTSHMITQLILWNSPSCTWEVAAGHWLQRALVVNHSILILHDRNRSYRQPDFWVVIVLWLGGYGPSTEKFWSYSHILPASLNHLWSIWLVIFITCQYEVSWHLAADMWLHWHLSILCQSISLFAAVEQMLKCHWSLQARLVYH